MDNETVDRGDAVNLARNVLDGGPTVTTKGVVMLCRAVLEMDGHIRSAGTQSGEIPKKRLDPSHLPAVTPDDAIELQSALSRLQGEVESANDAKKRAMHLYETTLDNEISWMRKHEAAEASLAQAERNSRRYEWLRDRMTFCNTHPGGRPVLYDTAARLWYHATDDVQSATLDAAIDASLSRDTK